MGGLKTYSHLAHWKRMPSEYEVVSTGLHYYAVRGFETEVPLAGWYRRYQQGCPLTCRDWERFRDPRQTTYTKYTELQTRQETYVTGLLESIDVTGYDRELSAAWRDTLGRVLAPLRYPVHGLQMIAAYVGQMGPSGRITLAALFQAADEMRRVQRLAYRLRQLQQTWPALGADARQTWQSDPLWQPLRETVERMLVAYDWGEAFVALNLVFKPVFDTLFLRLFGEAADRGGDPRLRQVLLALDEDCRWHREWSWTLVRTVLEDVPANSRVLSNWGVTWTPAVLRAAVPFGELLGDEAVNRSEAALRGLWHEAGLELSN